MLKPTNIFIILILLCYVILLILNSNLIEKFNVSKYKIIIINGQDYQMIYLKDLTNPKNNKIYKIYRNKFIT